MSTSKALRVNFSNVCRDVAGVALHFSATRSMGARLTLRVLE
jgi:hypothetical protein